MFSTVNLFEDYEHTNHVTSISLDVGFIIINYVVDLK